jgi:hypothetical protein
MIMKNGTANKLGFIDALAANFNAQMPAELKKMWLMLLEGYSAGMVAEAVRKVIESYEFKTLPPFAVLKRALDELAGVDGKSFELQAIAEWGVLGAAIAKHGYYSKPELHPTTEHVLSLMGGWEAACQWTYSDAAFRRRDFINLWTESHGRVEAMQLGAGGVQATLARGRSGIGVSTAAPAAALAAVKSSLENGNGG